MLTIMFKEMRMINIMKDFREYKLELLKRVSSLKILEIQKNELRGYIKKNLNEEIVNKKPPIDYLNHILKAYGKNNYTLYIVLNSILNFLIFNLVYIGMLVYKNAGFDNVIINSFIELTIFILTLGIFPFLKYIIRTGLLENWKGIKIIQNTILIISSFFIINFTIYKINFFTNLNFSINPKIIGSISIILILIIQLILRLYKYEIIEK